jgi:hypothetical protein
MVRSLANRDSGKKKTLFSYMPLPVMTPDLVTDHY